MSGGLAGEILIWLFEVVMGTAGGFSKSDCQLSLLVEIYPHSLISLAWLTLLSHTVKSACCDIPSSAFIMCILHWGHVVVLFHSLLGPNKTLASANMRLNCNKADFSFSLSPP